MSAMSTSPARGSRDLALAGIVAVTFYAIAGVCETLLIHVLQPSELERDWISDAILAVALGVAVYLWLHLRATRRALTAREREQVSIEAELSLAETLQRRLLPAVPPPTQGIEWAASLMPAGKIGGDFFDFLESVDGVRLMLLADVSGKGISAAMALMLVRSTFRHVARDTQSPAELAGEMSATFYNEWCGSPYVTAMVVRLDPVGRTLTYTNAGHPPGLLIRSNVDRNLGTGGPPLGLLANVRYAEECLRLQDGDICGFVTDGITEALDESTRPWRAVARDAVRSKTHSADKICVAIMRRAQEGRGPDGVDDWTDDRTVIVLRVHASLPAASALSLTTSGSTTPPVA